MPAMFYFHFPDELRGFYELFQREMSCPSKRQFATYNPFFGEPIKEYFCHFIFFPHSSFNNIKLWKHVAKTARYLGQQC